MHPPLTLRYLAGLIVCCCGVHAAAVDLPAAIARVVNGYNIPSDAVSFMVQAVDEDQPRLAVNVDTALNPASTIKLVTTYTALDMLGPTHTWPTQVYAIGPVNDGVLEGDLLIKGFGDPYLVLEDLWLLLGELRREGIRHIDGDLLLDDELYVSEATDADAFDGEGYRLYNVVPSALMVNFKSTDFILTHAPGSGVVEITTIPPLPNLKVTSRVKLVNGRCRGNSPQIIMDLSAHAAAGNQVIFSGRLPASCREYKLSRSVLSHDAYTYGAFKLLWEQWGGTIAGGYRNAAAPTSAAPVMVWQSRQLGEIVRPLNKWSNNVMTRLLLYTIGAASGPSPVTRQAGIDALRAHLEGLGLDISSLVVDNGAGLSRNARISAGLMIDLLDHAWHSPVMPEFVSSMAIAGKDGTMRRRFRGQPESGRMHLKTGRLDDVVAIAGYVHAKSGKNFMVCMLANHRGLHRGPGTELQDAFLSWTFRQ